MGHRGKPAMRVQQSPPPIPKHPMTLNQAEEQGAAFLTLGGGGGVFIPQGLFPCTKLIPLLAAEVWVERMM